MKKISLFFYFLCFPLLAGGNIIDILEKKDSAFSLQKQIEKDIGSVFANKPVLFIQAFESESFETALEIWWESIQNTPFANSATGSALYSYLLFENGFEVLSLNHLFKRSRPRQVNPIVSRLWKVNIDKNNPVWDYFYFPIPTEWQAILSPETVFKIGSKAPLHLTKNQDYIKSLLALPLNDKLDVFPLEWLFALSLIQARDMDSATRILSWLLSKTKDSYRKDKINLTVARLLADIGENQASLHYYQKIRSLSHFWFLAQEEMAWLYLGSANKSKAYSTALALNYPGFLKQISPSGMFVIALSQLKNCDDKGAIQSLINFKTAFLNQYLGLKQISDQKLYKNLIPPLLAFYNSKQPYYQIMPSLFSFSVPPSFQNKSLLQKPPSFQNNPSFQGNPVIPVKARISKKNKQSGQYKNSNFQTEKMNLFYNLRKDSKLKNDILLYNYMGTRRRNRNTKFKQLLALEDKIIENLKNKIQARANFLLQRELGSIQDTLIAFHLIETEVLYREHGTQKALTPLYKESWHKDVSLYKSNAFLYFPFNRKEIWLDELSDYKAGKNESCPEGKIYL